MANILFVALLLFIYFFIGATQHEKCYAVVCNSQVRRSTISCVMLVIQTVVHTCSTIALTVEPFSLVSYKFEVIMSTIVVCLIEAKA